MKRQWYQKGQTLLIVLLIMAVVTTIGLSLIGRTTTDVNMSAQVEDSSRAFSAAEAGVEQALKIGDVPIPSPLAGNVNYTVTKENLIGTGFIYPIIGVTDIGYTRTFSMAGYPSVAGSSISVCWDNVTNPAAVAIALYYQLGGDYRVSRVGYDSEFGVRTGPENNFPDAEENQCGADYHYSGTINIPVGSVPIWLRIRPLYDQANIAVNTDPNTIPVQGASYTSCGKTQTNVERCVNVTQQNKVPSGIFDFVLYSQNGDIINQ